MAGKQTEATLLLRIKEAGGAILDKFVITLGDVINLISSIPAAVMAAVDAYREEELAINRLTQSMIQQGVFTGDLRSEYLEMASALEKVTTFADDQIIAAEATLQSYLGQEKVTRQLLEATLDLAAGKQIDLASAATMVGKTIGTETDALARQGIVVADATTKGEKLANTIQAINSKLGGQAKATAEGLGSMDQLKNAWSNFMENAGALLAPFVSSLTKATTKVLEFFNSFAGPNVATMKVEDINKEILKLHKTIIEVKDAAAARGDYNSGDKALVDSLQLRIQAYRDARTKIEEQEQLAAENAKARAAEKAAAERDARIAQSESELLDLAVKEQIKMDTELAAQVSRLDAIIANEKSHTERLKALRQKALIEKSIADKLEVQTEKQKNEQMMKDRSAFLNQVATMQSSSNKTLAAIGKAAAIAQITINTAEAAQSGFKWGMAIGGPPLAATFAGLAYAAGAAQIAKVSGVQLAEGGIVMPRPGGTQATIGEAGQAEAVIPLDRAGEFGLGGGGGNTIIFNGPVMGDESQAMEFARAIDRSLLKLRQSNQSVAFETDIA